MLSLVAADDEAQFQASMLRLGKPASLPHARLVAP
jgi:hypothetical protein